MFYFILHRRYFNYVHPTMVMMACNFCINFRIKFNCTLLQIKRVTFNIKQFYQHWHLTFSPKISRERLRMHHFWWENIFILSNVCLVYSIVCWKQYALSSELTDLFLWPIDISANSNKRHCTCYYEVYMKF